MWHRNRIHVRVESATMEAFGVEHNPTTSAALTPTPTPTPTHDRFLARTRNRPPALLLSMLLSLGALAPSLAAAFATPPGPIAPFSGSGSKSQNFFVQVPLFARSPQASPRRRVFSRLCSSPPSSSSTGAPDGSSVRPDPDLLFGVSDFEEWFDAASADGAKSRSVKHTSFDSGFLRGLEFTSTKSSDLKNVMALPRKLVLRTPYSESPEKGDGCNWDAKLSVALLRECARGKVSGYYGYCSLLTRGVSMNGGATDEYPPTASDALRHWTPDQRARLEPSKAGRRLLRVEEDQRAEWASKYESLSPGDRKEFSYERYAWAMEAVHSRAFRGDFGDLNSGEGGKFRAAASFLLPLSALAFGIFYATDPLLGMDSFFLPLSIVAAAPLALNAIADRRGSMDAVLLPFIDSANHLEEADSLIEYDQLSDTYTLSLGRKCLVKEADSDGESRAQVCVSYGVRKDVELLLNYGFLRGVKVGADGEGEESPDSMNDHLRMKLAEAFVSRNP